MKRALMRSFAIAALLIGATPAHAQEKIEEFLGYCDDDNKICVSDQAQFKKWFPLAWKRDYQGQRNVAFCLRDGCEGSVLKNPTLACAWRMVILASASSKIDQTDFANFRISCGFLDAAERSVARGQANNLMKKIYRKSIPADLEISMIGLPAPR